MQIEELRVKITAEMSGLKKNLDEMRGKMKGLDKNVKDTQNSIDSISKTATAGMNSASKATEQARLEMAKLVKEVDKTIARYGDLTSSMRGANKDAVLEIDAEEARKQLDFIQKRINEYYEELDKTKMTLDAGVKDPQQFMKLTNDVARLTAELNACEDEATKLQAKLIMKDNGVFKTTKSIEDLKLELLNTDNALKQAQTKLQELANIDIGSDEFQEQTEIVAQLINKYNLLNNTIKVAQQTLNDSSNTKNKWEGVRKAVDACAKAGAKVVKAFANIYINVGKSTVAVMKFMGKLNPIPKIADKLGRAFKSLREKIVAAFIYSAINTWFNNIRNQIASYLKINTQLRNALAKNTGAWLTAFQPIYEVVIPALVNLLNWLTKVGYALARFTSQFNGKSVKQNQENAESLYNEAKAIENVGSSAKKATKALASFDEVNILSKGSMDAGGGTDFSEITPQFDEIPEAEEYQTWGEAFSAMLDKLNSKLPTFQDMMKSCADNINKFSANVVEMFSFDGVQEKITTLAVGVAQGINNLVSGIDWIQLGQAIGWGIESAFNFAVNFINAFDWGSVGRGFADTFNGIFQQVDGAKLGALLVAPFNIAFQTLNGFVSQLDWSALGAEISDALEGACEAIDIDSFVGTIQGILTGIIESITTFFEDTDWALVAQTISEGFVKVADALSGFLQETDWARVGNAVIDGISEFFTNFDWEGFISSIVELAGSLIGASVSLVATLASAIGDLIGNALTGAYEYFAEKVEECGGDIIQGILDGIVDGMVGIGTWITSNIFEPFIDGFKKAFGIHSPSTVMFEQGEYITEGLLEGTESGWSDYMGWIDGSFSEFILACGETWESIKEDANDKWDEIYGDITEWVADTKADVENDWTALSGNLLETIEAYKEDGKKKWDTIKIAFLEKTQSIREECEGSFEAMKDSMVDIFEELSTKIKRPVNLIIDVINGMIRGAVSGINAVIKAINSVRFTVPTNKVTEFFGIAGKGWSGFNIKQITAPQIPRLADGGVIYQPTLAMMGEYAGARNNPEIVAPENKLREVFESTNNGVVEALIQQTRQLLVALEQMNMEVCIGDDVIAQSAQRGNQAYRRRTGKPLFV